MKKEYSDDVMATMDHALLPRNKNGLIMPMAFYGPQQEETYYPILLPNEEGLIRPMMFAEEFADGKLPPDLRFVKGHDKPNMDPFNGTNFDSIVYENPVYNLPPSDLYSYNVGQLARSNPSVAIEVLNNGQPLTVHRVKRGAYPKLDDEIINYSDGMMMLTPKGDYPLSNFNLYAVEHRVIIGKNENDPPRDNFEVLIVCKGKKKTLLIPSKDLDNLVKRIQDVMPICLVSPRITRGAQSITLFARAQLDALPQKYYVQRTGFVKVQDRWIYVHDAGKSPDENVVFQTGKTIPVATSISPKETCTMALQVLDLSEKKHVIVPLFLLMHLGPLFKLFEVAGYIPRFVTFLNGRTGSLKTSLVTCIFRLYQEQLDTPEANFKDTETALEIKLGEANGHVLLIDDYRPPVTSASGKQNLEKLESIIRFVGDRISKSRSNPELGKAKEFRPTGCCIVTGEDTGGSHSSLLRCLVLSVAKGDIDGAKLRRYQDDPLILFSHMNHFLEWCSANSTTIIERIKCQFPLEREFFQSYVHELRLVDTGATLMVMCRIFFDYAVEVRALERYSLGVELVRWQTAILTALNYSESHSKEMNPAAMYLRALFDLCENGSLLIADSMASFFPDKHVGYIKGDCWWLQYREIFCHIVQYWSRFNVLFPLTLNKINEHLADNGLIEVDIETCGDREKKLYTKKSSLKSRKRMMVLNLTRARSYLTQELDE